MMDVSNVGKAVTMYIEWVEKDLSHNRDLKETGEQGHQYLKGEYSSYRKLKVQKPCQEHSWQGASKDGEKWTWGKVVGNKTVGA